MKRYSQGEIQFNLMAVVSDRKMMYERELKILQEVIELTKRTFIKLNDT